MTQPEKTELGLLPRLIAAGWFAGAACIPVVFFFGVIGRMFFFGPSAATAPGVASIFIGIPVSMAAFFGFSIGSGTLDHQMVTRASTAAIRGVLVSILSYLGFMLAYTAIVASTTSKEPVDVISSALSVLGLGAILVGWLIVLAGALSGWLLFRVGRNRLHARLSSATKASTALYLNLCAGLVLLTVLLACWLPLRKEAKRENAEQARRDLTDAVWRNDPARVSELLASGLSVETQDVAGATLLVTAAQKGHTRIVKTLLNHAANPNVTENRNGRRTPLLWAVVNADFESIRLLLDHGANVNTPDEFGHTPLMEAAWATNAETVKSLIDHGADVNYKAPDGQTALSWARSRRDNTPTKLDKVDMSVLDQNADVGENIIDSRDFINEQIMSRARARHDAIIELLVSYGAK